MPVLLVIALTVTLVFVILKLTGVIDWTWLAVVSPILVYLAAVLGFFMVCGVCVVVILIAIFLFVVGYVVAAAVIDWWDSR